MTSNQEIDRLFELHSNSFESFGRSSLKERKHLIRGLLKAIISRRSELAKALETDFGKSETESYLSEIYPTVSDLRYILANLGDWMRPRKVGSPLMLMGTSSRYLYESKGQVLVIAPWNYSVVLTVTPLAMSVAAGNVTIVKPSELTPHTSAVISDIVAEVFPEDVVRVVEGGVSTSTHLLTKPFHHISFTGSPRVGKIVMEAAAKHLSSVVLELGGKSPAIVGPDASFKMAVRRIAWAKTLNAGQICIAPDYVLIQEKDRERFIEGVREEWRRMFPEGSKDLTGIIDKSHIVRLSEFLPQDQRRTDRLRMDPVVEKSDHLAPKARTEEVFGPILPVYSYRDQDEAIRFINEGERPLTMYIYNNSKKWNDEIMNRTRSGSVVINHSLVHFFNSALPFGGVNNSGMGRYHGISGFESFSNKRAVLKQWFPWSATALLEPPYDRYKKRLMEFLIKWI